MHFFSFRYGRGGFHFIQHTVRSTVCLPLDRKVLLCIWMSAERAKQLQIMHNRSHTPAVLCGHSLQPQCPKHLPESSDTMTLWWHTPFLPSLTGRSQAYVTSPSCLCSHIRSRRQARQLRDMKNPLEKNPFQDSQCLSADSQHYMHFIFLLISNCPFKNKIKFVWKIRSNCF